MPDSEPRLSRLQELLGPVPAEEFLKSYYQCRPLAMTGLCRELVSLGARSTALRLMDEPEADILISREGDVWKGGRPSSALAPELLAQGFTIAVRHADRHDAGLAGLARQFKEELHAPVDLQLYWTPAGHPGLGWHYDAEEVFLLQTEGEKEWSLRKNTVNPWPLLETLPRDMRYEREISPLMKCTLRAGDWLYLPSGYWHSARAGAKEESISLSIGLLPPTGLDLFDFLRTRLLDSMLWRERLPVSGMATGEADQVSAEYRARIANLAADLASLLAEPWLADRFLEERHEMFSTSQPGSVPPTSPRPTERLHREETK